MPKLINENSRAEKALPAASQPAPDFFLSDHDGEKWELSAHRGKVVCLLFYPQSETLVCNRQLCSLRDNWSDYVKTNATVVGVSPGTPEIHRSFSRKHGLPLPLLADPLRKVTKLYGQHWLYPIQLTRAIVVVDARGAIRYRKIMLRAFRPTDYSVITAIYAAKTDAAHERMENLLYSHRKNI